MKNLRIFISSPGDVRQERLIAKKVIAELNQIYSEYVRIEPIMWEDLPLEATSSFQHGIDYFLSEAPIDIAIFILWSRLGSTLGRAFMKGDGTEYRSGTEYEYDTMLSLKEKTGRPKIFVYVKDAEPQYGTGLSRKDIKDCIEQQEMLNDFIEEKFRDRETGTNYAYWQFDKQTTFEERFGTHLKRLVREHIGRDVVIKEWNGNPYLGLRSFGIKESMIFCGRKELSYDVLGKLESNAESPDVESLLVLGASGSGKSSFVMAGLLPLMYSNDAALLDSQVLKCQPSDFHGAVYSGIYGLLYGKCRSLHGNPALENLREGIPGNYDYKYLQYALTADSDSRGLCLVIDQFEEIFNDSAISEDERLRTLSLLNILVQTGRLRVIIIMRNDFYGTFTAYPALGAIKKSAVVVDVPDASVASLAEIIEEPARKANLRWEVDEHGMALNKRIIQDAMKINSLPLIEFAMSELYKACESTGVMTFAEYGNIGEICGAVSKYADKVYASLDDEEKKIFDELLSCVVTVSHDDKCKYVRKTSLRGMAEKTPRHAALLDKLVASHLFVSSKDSGGDATFTIAHEMLITSWSAVREWIRKEAEFIDRNDHYERQAKYWDSNGRKKKDLIYERSVLLEAEYFMYKNEKKIQRPTFDYLDCSLLSNRRKGGVFYLVGLIFLVIVSVFGSIALLSGDIDEDMKDMFGAESMGLFQCLSMFVPVLLAVGHAAMLRLNPVYTYKSIRRSAWLWAFILVFIVSVAVYDQVSGTADFIGNFLWCVLFILCGLSVFVEAYRRKLWSKLVFKPYLFTDKLEKVKETVIGVVVLVSALAVLIGYGVVIYEKNDRYEKTLQVADELFDGLNNLRNQLSWSDNLYVNQKRMVYLTERFTEELTDTVPDRREGEYAQCLYNTYDPCSALKYLYPDYYWNHHFLWILCTMQAGLYDDAESALENYVEAGRYDDFTWASTADLIWIAEKLGRFDLAENLYAVGDSNAVDWRTKTPAGALNYGHIYLSKGNIETACHYYDEAMKLYKSMMASDQDAMMKTALAQDLYTFRWLGVCDTVALGRVMARYDIAAPRFYTSADEETKVFTAEMVTRLAGCWATADTTMIIDFDTVLPLCKYRCFDKNDGNEINRLLTNFRCSRHDGRMFIEELNQNSTQWAVSSSEITEITDSVLVLRIIENGYEPDRGQVRWYVRYNEALGG